MAIEGGARCIDLRFRGLPDVIASYLIEDSGELGLIETGPGTTFNTLLSSLHDLGVDPGTISSVLLTHIHLDHAGAAGEFATRFPAAQVYVHPLGAPHLADPSRLLTSAARIYGDRMEALWGRVMPVPRERITPLQDGDTISIGRRTLRAIYTPGHAVHHVIYHDPDRDAVFAGDAAAVRLDASSYVRPPTPPPDIDLEAWRGSLKRVRELHPRTLLLTHFGAYSDVDHHLDETERRLTAWVELVQREMERGSSREQIVDLLKREGDAEIHAATDDPDAVRQYELATPYGMTVDGIMRYLRKRPAREAAGPPQPAS